MFQKKKKLNNQSVVRNILSTFLGILTSLWIDQNL